MVSISIIMPLYNAEKYLQESLESILNQTFKNYELICINDASTDATVKIVKEFAKKDERIKLYQQNEHKGAAEARNFGMKQATGKYLSFLDGDDIFDEEMLELAYRQIENKAADVIMFEYRHVTSDRIYNKCCVFHSENFIRNYCDKVFSMKEIEPYGFLRWSFALDNKLYRKKYIEEIGIKFQTLSCANDVYFVLMAVYMSNRINVLNSKKVMLCARDHEEISRISYNRDPMCTYLALIKWADELTKRKKFKEVAEQYFYILYQGLISALRQTKSGAKAKEFYIFLGNEGLKAIFKQTGTNLKHLGCELEVKFSRFYTESFETKWFEREDSLNIFLENKKGELRHLFYKLKQQNKKLGIWGAGENGEILLTFCRNNGLELDYIVDSSKMKQGKYWNGYIVNKPEWMYNKEVSAFVCGRNIFSEVVKDSNIKKEQLIDIYQVLEMA